MYRNTTVLQNRTKNRAKPHHRNLTPPSARFQRVFLPPCNRTCSLQNSRRTTGTLEGEKGERKEERESNGRTKTRYKPPRTFSSDTKKKKTGTQGRVYLWFSIRFFLRHAKITQPVLRDQLVERQLCDYLGYCVIIIAFCIISNSHNH